MTQPRQRSTAQERRPAVLRAAIRSFAAKGYYGTSTMDVAKAAGISQGYLYRLFPGKEALFAAVIDHASVRLREHAAGVIAKVTTTDSVAILEQLKSSYRDLIDDRDLLMILMHGNCAAGEPAIGEAIRSCYAQQVEYLRSVSGASPEHLRRYFADTLLANTVMAAGIDTIDAPWSRALRG